MIPKKIHYIWVGGKEKSDEAKRCIKTWKAKFKDFEIVEWNEEKFDIMANPYTKAAYEAKKWAFVSDYIRLYALYTEGGVYLDTDVIAVENIEEFLDNRAFISFENGEYLSAAIMAAEKGHPFIKDMMEYYDRLDTTSFNFEDNNSIIVTNILKEKYGCYLNNQEQVLKEGVHVYDDGIFSNPSMKSRTIHAYSGTWIDGKRSWKRRLDKYLKLRLTNKRKIKKFLKMKKIMSRIMP